MKKIYLVLVLGFVVNTASYAQGKPQKYTFEHLRKEIRLFDCWKSSDLYKEKGSIPKGNMGPPHLEFNEDYDGKSSNHIEVFIFKNSYGRFQCLSQIYHGHNPKASMREYEVLFNGAQEQATQKPKDIDVSMINQFSCGYSWNPNVNVYSPVEFEINFVDQNNITATIKSFNQAVRPEYAIRQEANKEPNLAATNTGFEGLAADDLLKCRESTRSFINSEYLKSE